MRQPFGKLLLFGATGDLAQRMLIPSLYGLHADHLLPDGLTITGTARSTLSDAEYRDFCAKALQTYLPEDRKDAAAIAAFLARIQYQPLDASTIEGYDDLAKKLGDIPIVAAAHDSYLGRAGAPRQPDDLLQHRQQGLGIGMLQEDHLDVVGALGPTIQILDQRADSRHRRRVPAQHDRVRTLHRNAPYRALEISQARRELGLAGAWLQRFDRTGRYDGTIDA